MKRLFQESQNREENFFQAMSENSFWMRLNFKQILTWSPIPVSGIDFSDSGDGNILLLDPLWGGGWWEETVGDDGACRGGYRKTNESLSAFKA